MKKRILSMLLLVAMIVTALPLFALPTLAATKSEANFAEEDYNDLYVQDGLTLAFDIMRTNPYWKEALEEFPKSPMTYTAYEYEGHVYDFTDPMQRYDWDTEYYLVQQTQLSNGQTLMVNGALANNFHHYATLADAEKAAAAMSKSGYTYAAVGPFKAAVIRATKGSDGVLYNYTDMLLSVAYSTGYTSREEAIAAAQAYAGSTEKKAHGGYENKDYAYFPIGMDQNAAYKKAGSDYYAAVNKWFVKYTWKSVAINSWSNTDVKSGSNASTHANRFNTRRDSRSVYAAVLDPVQDQGYLVRSYPFCTDQGIQIGMLTPKNGATLEMVTRIGARAKTNFVIFANLRPYIANETIQNLWGDAKKANYFINPTEVVQNAIDRTSLTTLRVTLGMSDVAGKDTASYTQDDTVLYSAEGDYTANNTAIIGYMNSAGDMQIYNIRTYDRALSDAEKAQNHFADIVKWFKLDLAPLSLLGEEDMPKLYAALADFTFESDRDTVAKAFLDAAVAIALDKYADLSPDYVSLAVQYGLDLSVLQQLPKYLLGATYAFLDGGYASATDVRAEYESAIAADIADIAAKATLSYADYNTLYVQDDLATALDYFATNEYWKQSALAANDETYVWKWSVFDDKDQRKISLKANAGTVAGGALTVSGQTDLGSTHEANGYAANGMTTEFVLRDSAPGGGTIFDIDDLRIQARTDGVKINLAAIGQRAFYGSGDFRLPEVTTSTDGNRIYKPYEVGMGFLYEDAVRTFVFRHTVPAHTQDYYNYNYKNVSDAYAAEHKEFVLPTDEQLATYKDGKLTLTQDICLSKGRTYFYITHDSEGNILPTAEQVQFAFHKPIYTEIDGKVYITDSIYRGANLGVGLGEGGDFYHTEPASISMGIDGKELFSVDNLIAPNNKGITGGTILLYSYNDRNSKPVSRDIYAYRSYARELTDAELAQNHFVDIAKFYKLNLNGFEMLDDAAKAAVYATVADARIGEVDREDVQLAVTAAIHAAIVDVYDAMKGEDAAANAFIDFAAEYYLDIDAILASKRNMSSVYATAFEGAADEMQSKVDKAFYNAYYFLSYQVKDEDAWNAWLSAVAAAGTVSDLESLMALPFAERLGILDEENNTDAAVIAAYTARAMEKYSAGLPTYDYNQLYLRDGLAFAFDVMKTNAYWGEAFAEYPTLPTDLTAYEYDMNGDGEIAETEKFDFTNFDNRYEHGKYTVVQHRITLDKATGEPAINATNGKKTIYTTGHTATLTMPDGTKRTNSVPRFDTVADAEAYIDTLITKSADGSYAYTYEVLKPYLVVSRVKNADARDGYATYKNVFSGYSPDNTYRHENNLGDDYVSYSFDTVEQARAAYPDAETHVIVPNAPHYAFYAAVDAFYKEEGEWINDYVWSQNELGSKVSMFSGNPFDGGNALNQARDALLIYGAFETPVDGRGYLTIEAPVTTDKCLVFNDQFDKDADSVAAQIVARTGNKITSASSGSSFHLFFNARPQISVNKQANEFSFTKVIQGFVSSGDAIVSKPVSTKDVVSMTISLNGATTANAADSYDTYTVRTPLETVYQTNGLYGSGKAGKLNNTNQIGYGNTMSDAEIYAVRYYNRDLTADEIMQNNFADLAKFYRLELAGYNMMDDEQKADAHKALAAYSVGDAERDELQAILNAEVAKLYEGTVILEDEAANAKFIMLAAAATLDLAPIKMLTREAREAFATAMITEFNSDYAVDPAVVAYHYAARTATFAAMTFAGYQVRLDSGASFANYAGVRAVFDINEDAIAAILAKDENAGKAITLTTSMIGEETVTLSFVYTLVDGALKCDTDAIVYERGGGKSVNYTATYKDAEFTKENLELEFSYAYTIALGDAAAIAFEVNTATFGDKVSAAEVYGYFYENGYETDRMVADVMAKLAN